MGNIVWLASYPKSGNTWLRVVVGQIIEGAGGSANGVSLINDGISSSRQSFDDIVGIEASELELDTIDELRPLVYETISAESKRPLFVKAHDAYRLNSIGKPLFSPGATRAVIHIVRNPLDIVLSYSAHLVADIDATIDRMCNPREIICQNINKMSSQLTQNIFDWSGHTKSWLDCPLPRLTIRYEDMLEDPESTFSSVMKFSGIEFSDGMLKAAIKASRFDVLKGMEQKYGFKEKPRGAKQFFRAGKAGEGRLLLTPAQIERVVLHNYELMNFFGYL